MTTLTLSDRQAAVTIYLANNGAASDSRLWRVAGVDDGALEAVYRLGLVARTAVGGRGHVYRLTALGADAARVALDARADEIRNAPRTRGGR